MISASAPAPPQFVLRLIETLGFDIVKNAPEDLGVYAYDASYEGSAPAAVVFPRDAKDVSTVVQIAAEYHQPVVPRGAGTGLCGGAVPIRGGVVVSSMRMNRILHLDVPNRRARVQPGVINDDLSKATLSSGLFYAPDPSSQKISTIGGNVATNAGGPHCLSHGVTVNHVLGLELVNHVGEILHIAIDDPG